MKGIVHKLRTALSYTRRGVLLGADLRSRWLLASALPRLKWQGERDLRDGPVEVADIRLGGLRRRLSYRLSDIFIIYEVLGQNPYVVHEIQQERPRCILDLGSHIGLATLQFKASFPHAEIHCFEPDPENFRLLERNIDELRGVYLHSEAVGGESGTAPFYVNLHRHNGSSLLMSSKKGEEVAPVITRVRTLDEILAEAGQTVDVVKFDIEGMEYKTFQASRLVHRVRWVVGELKGTKEDINRFLVLFPEHEGSVRWITPKMAYIYLARQGSDEQ